MINCIFNITVANYFYIAFFISVKGQSLEVTPDPVIGVMGGSVDITWTFTKKAESDKIISVRIFFGNQTDGNLLYKSGDNNFIQQNYAKINYGERMEATFGELKYTLTLRNLSFSDLLTFTLIVTAEDRSFNTLPNEIKSVKIIEVRGRQFLSKIFYFFPCFDLY